MALVLTFSIVSGIMAIALLICACQVWYEQGFFDADVAKLLMGAALCAVISAAGICTISDYNDKLGTYTCTNAACTYEVRTVADVAFCPDCGEQLLLAPDACGDCGYTFSGNIPTFCTMCGAATN